METRESLKKQELQRRTVHPNEIRAEQLGPGGEKKATFCMWILGIS